MKTSENLGKPMEDTIVPERKTVGQLLCSQNISMVSLSIFRYIQDDGFASKIGQVKNPPPPPLADEGFMTYFLLR